MTLQSNGMTVPPRGGGLLKAALAVAVLCLTVSVLPPGASGQEYSIGEGDLLRITVYDNPDLATNTRVSGEGKITFPLIGDIKVNGLTTAEVQQQIAARLQEGFIKKPEVSVFIAEYKSKKVTALGEFLKPGLIELRGNASLMEVVSNAGGVTPNAGEELVIKRKVVKPGQSDPEDVTITLPLKEFLEGGGTGEPVMVVDGDSIYVARAVFPRVSTLGEFNKPGLIELRGSATLMDAISNAGGVTINAGDEVVIRRKVIKANGTSSEEVSITAPLAPYLEGRISNEQQLVLKDGDSVYVPRAVFIRVSMLGEFVKPGLMELRGNASLMEAISSAGGVTANAGDDLVIKSKVKTARDGQPETDTVTVPLTAFMEGRYPGGKTTVADGDTIYVARAAFAFVSGAVKTPGAYKITQGLTVLKAITLAGGFTQRAAKNKVEVIRKSESGDTTIPVTMETLVQSDDVVVVPESFF